MLCCCIVTDDVVGPCGGIPTAGGVSIEFHGSYLGLADAVLSMRYSGGAVGSARHTYTSHSCHVIVPNAHVSCVAAPGVGANYSFQWMVASVTTAAAICCRT